MQLRRPLLAGGAFALAAACTSSPLPSWLGGGGGSLWGGTAPAADSGDAPSPTDTADSGADTPDTAPPDDTGPSTPPPLATVDVVVIGGGASGLSAATTVIEAGGTVLILERESTTGGGGQYARNFWAAATQWQADAGYADTIEDATRAWESETGGDASHPLVAAFIAESAATIEWLVGHGATFSLGRGGMPPRLHQPGSTHPVEPLTAYCADHIWTHAEATGLIMDDQGLVGVEVRSVGEAAPDALRTAGSGWVSSGAVVVATGGFARNEDWVLRAVPALVDVPRYIEAWPGMDGNGLEMLMAQGADLSNLDQLSRKAHSVQDVLLGAPESMLTLEQDDAIIVDATGTRIAHEDDYNDPAIAYDYATRGPFWIVQDADQWAEMYFTGRYYNYLADPTQRALTGPEYAALASLPIADDVETLGGLMGVDPATLVASVDRYNGFFIDGVDADFNKSLASCSPVDTPPYTAVMLVNGVAKSNGGVRLSTSAEVLDADGSPLPGVYAAGEVAGFMGGTWWGHGMEGSVTTTYFVGRIAGSAALEYTRNTERAAAP